MLLTEQHLRNSSIAVTIILVISLLIFLKFPSFVFVMTVKNITAIAKVEVAYGYHYFESYFVIFIIYIVICGVIQYIFKILENQSQLVGLC